MRKFMLSPLQRSSSTCITGMLAAARPSPVLSRRTASSRPRRWGIETTSGADMIRGLDGSSSHSHAGRARKGSMQVGTTRPVSKPELTNVRQVALAHGTGANDPFHKGLEEIRMSIGTIILIILVIALLGGFSGIGGGPFYGTGYYGGGGLGLVIVILLILLLMGKL